MGWSLKSNPLKKRGIVLHVDILSMHFLETLFYCHIKGKL